MARSATVTYAQVAQIADTMKAANLRPTARAVRERIGTGSMGTIHRLLSQWAGTAPAETVDAPELPEELAAILMDFVSTQVATACEPISEATRRAKEDAEALAEENIRLSAIIDALTHEAEEARSSRDTLAGTLSATESALHDCQVQLRHALAENSGMNRTIEQLSARVADLEGLPHELDEANSALAHARQIHADADKRAAVLEAKLEATQAQAAGFADRAADALAKLDTEQQNGKNLFMQVQACNARLEAAARELEDTRAEAKATRAELKAAKEEAAELRGQLKARPATVKKTKAPVTAKEAE